MRLELPKAPARTWMTLSTLVLAYLIFTLPLVNFTPLDETLRLANVAKGLLVEGSSWIRPGFDPFDEAGSFHQPPLAIWGLALIFETLGTSNATLQIPGILFGIILFALLTIWWRAEKNENPSPNSLAVFALMTSWIWSRNATQFLLEHFLVTTLFAYLLVFRWTQRHPARRLIIPAFLMSFLLALSILSYGIGALGGPVMIFLSLVVFGKTSRAGAAQSFARLAALIVSSTLLCGLWIVPWLVFGEGTATLDLNWTDMTQFGWAGSKALELLSKSYWPWSVFFFWGSVVVFRKGFNDGDPSGVASAFMTLYFFIQASLQPDFGEHHLIPALCFAAPIVVTPIVESWSKAIEPLSFGTFAITMLILLVFATMPIPFHQEPDADFAKAASRTVESCKHQDIGEILISEEVLEIERASALAQWLTPWKVRFVPKPFPPGFPGQLLLLNDDDVLPRGGWNPWKVFRTQRYRVYEPLNTGYCDRKKASSL